MAALVGPLCGKRDTHIHDTSDTYMPFPQLFAKGNSLKSEGIGMPQDKNKGLHGNCLIGPCWTKSGESPQYTVNRESIFRLPGNHLVNQPRVEYTSLTQDCLWADLRSPGSTRGKWPRQWPTFFILYSQPKALHPQPSTYPQSSDKNFTTTTTPVYNCNS
jgi:hypothetical protein